MMDLFFRVSLVIMGMGVAILGAILIMIGIEGV